MNKVYCYCQLRARARACVCVWWGGGGGMFLCVCVCVRGCYLECLTVDRESQVCVYSPVARYKVVASS